MAKIIDLMRPALVEISTIEGYSCCKLVFLYKSDSGDYWVKFTESSENHFVFYSSDCIKFITWADNINHL